MMSLAFHILYLTAEPKGLGVSAHLSCLLDRKSLAWHSTCVNPHMCTHTRAHRHAFLLEVVPLLQTIWLLQKGSKK